MVETLQQPDPVQGPPTISIIVACREIDEYVRECIQECLRLDYPRFELFVLPDKVGSFSDSRVRIIVTGPVTPSEKRNIASKTATGELLAFLDGDAYPDPSWLKNSVKYFEDAQMGAIGGPGLTPQSDAPMQKASGDILSSFLGSGPLSFRHSAKLPRRSDDLPTVNLIVRRSVFQQLGGFDLSFWPGEDTKFCRDLVYGIGKKAIYAPDVLVYHHRRFLFRPHLKQIAGYGLHRGFFTKKFPENSRRAIYFLPSLVALGIPGILILGYLLPSLRLLSLIPLIVYAVSVAIGAIIVGLRRRSPTITGAVFLGTIATHFWYATFFLKGLLSRRIEAR